VLEKTRFLTIFATYNALDTIRQTLPSIVEETRRSDARLIVHDSSDRDRDAVWAWLQERNRNRDFFLVLTDNLSMADARNMCLRTGIDLFAPDYVCMLEDDHGYRPGLIPAMISSMEAHYGKRAPNGLRYGLFTGCRTCFAHHNYIETDDGDAYPAPDCQPIALGGVNSCFRCAPTSHWISVLKGYDPDEYMISNFQTRNCNFRNYNNGFTTRVVANGRLTFSVERHGRGYTRPASERLFDETYTKSDGRAVYWKGD
jgi:glycosyltransferase involved in cell wall biosynthesis